MAREILDCERVGRTCSFEGGEFDVLLGQAKTGTCRACELLTLGADQPMTHMDMKYQDMIDLDLNQTRPDVGGLMLPDYPKASSTSNPP